MSDTGPRLRGMGLFEGVFATEVVGIWTPPFRIQCRMMAECSNGRSPTDSGMDEANCSSLRP